VKCKKLSQRFYENGARLATADWKKVCGCDYKARFIFEILIKEDVTACSPLGYPFTCSVFDAVTAFRGVTIVAFGRLRFPEAPRPGAGEEPSHYNKLYFF